MRRVTNPIERKDLLSTRNALYLKGSSNQVVNIAKSSAWNFGSGDFTISILGQFGVDGFLLESSAASEAALSITLSSISFRSSENVTYTLTPSSDRYKLNRLNRITIIRRGTVLECWLNNVLSAQQTVGTNTFNLNASQPRIRIGDRSDATGIAPFTGFAANLVVIKAAMSHSQLESFHHNNIIPQTLHVNVVAQYPLNHNVGIKAYDVVEQYNYAKTTTVSAVHGDLINYTNDEAGVTNPLLQTAWQNIYDKKKVGLNHLPGNGSNLYAEILGYSSSPSAWCIFFEYALGQGYTGNSALFAGNDSTSDRLVIRQSGTSILGYINSTLVFNINNGASPNTLRIGLHYTGSVLRRFTESEGWVNVGSNPTDTFNIFRFLRQNTASELYAGNKFGVGRCVYINRSVTTREEKIIANLDRSNDYKNISGIQFDLDFGDAFLDTGNYFARDNSGNNRHARLYNWTPATDQPIRLEQNTGLPERRKALRLERASSEYISVAGFNPTAEKGYTHLIGFKAIEPTSFPNVQGILSKEGGGLKFFSFEGTTLRGGFNSQASLAFKTFNKINFAALTEDKAANRIKNYINGTLVENVAGGASFLGWHEVGGNFEIGGRSGPGQFFDGHLFFVGVWKGILTQVQILDIFNNGLAGNAAPSLMSDCQLYLNFEEIINDGGVFKIKDWSPQNRTAILNGYSLAEITPGDPAYKLFDLDTLR
jgi:hypothetical protein